MEACVGIKQYFARIAREVTDVVFLEMVVSVDCARMMLVAREQRSASRQHQGFICLSKRCMTCTCTSVHCTTDP